MQGRDLAGVVGQESPPGLRTRLDPSPDHSHLAPHGHVLGHQCGTTDKEASNEQPHSLKNARPRTSFTRPNGRIVRPMSPNGNRRKAFAPKADEVFARDSLVRARKGLAGPQDRDRIVGKTHGGREPESIWEIPN